MRLPHCRRGRRDGWRHRHLLPVLQCGNELPSVRGQRPVRVLASPQARLGVVVRGVRIEPVGERAREHGGVRAHITVLSCDNDDTEGGGGEARKGDYSERR